GMIPTAPVHNDAIPSDNPWITVAEEETGTKPPHLSRLWQSHIRSVATGTDTHEHKQRPIEAGQTDRDDREPPSSRLPGDLPTADADVWHKAQGTSGVATGGHKAPDRGQPYPPLQLPQPLDLSVASAETDSAYERPKGLVGPGEVGSESRTGSVQGTGSAQ